MEVLDHGYVRFVEAWGHGDADQPEAGIIEAARQSTQGSFRGWDRDEKLLRFMYEHHHSSPFEFAGMVIEVQAPLFVFREWHRHRTQSYNELSARYTELPDLFYIPSLERLMNGAQATTNKQGSTTGLDQVTAECAQVEIRTAAEAERGRYNRLLASGVARELARIVIPVGQYSRMRASANLRNWLAFLTLRLDPAAQWEIRQYANAVADIIAEKFPRTHALFNEGRQLDTKN